MSKKPRLRPSQTGDTIKPRGIMGHGGSHGFQYWAEIDRSNESYRRKNPFPDSFIPGLGQIEEEQRKKFHLRKSRHRPPEV